MTSSSSAIGNIRVKLGDDNDTRRRSIGYLSGPAEGLGKQFTFEDSSVSLRAGDSVCEVCEGEQASCVGHAGHLEFPEPVLLPQFADYATDLLNGVCVHCSRLLLRTGVVNHAACHALDLRSSSDFVPKETAPSASGVDCEYWRPEPSVYSFQALETRRKKKTSGEALREEKGEVRGEFFFPVLLHGLVSALYEEGDCFRRMLSICLEMHRAGGGHARQLELSYLDVFGTLLRQFPSRMKRVHRRLCKLLKRGREGEAHGFLNPFCFTERFAQPLLNSAFFSSEVKDEEGMFSLAADVRKVEEMIQACTELRSGLLQSLQQAQRNLSKLQPLLEKARARLARLGGDRRSLEAAVASLRAEAAVSGADGCSRKLSTKRARLVQKEAAARAVEEKKADLQKKAEALERDIYGLNMRSVAIFFMIGSFKLVLHTPRCLLLCLGFNAEHAVSFFRVRLDSLRQRQDRARFSGVTRLRSRCPEAKAAATKVASERPGEGAGSALSAWQYLSAELVRDRSFLRQRPAQGSDDAGDCASLQPELSACARSEALSRRWVAHLNERRAQRLERLFSRFDVSCATASDGGALFDGRDGWAAKARLACGKNRLSAIYENHLFKSLGVYFAEPSTPLILRYLGCTPSAQSAASAPESRATTSSTTAAPKSRATTSSAAAAPKSRATTSSAAAAPESRATASSAAAAPESRATASSAAAAPESRATASSAAAFSAFSRLAAAEGGEEGLCRVLEAQARYFAGAPGSSEYGKFFSAAVKSITSTRRKRQVCCSPLLGGCGGFQPFIRAHGTRQSASFFAEEEGEGEEKRKKQKRPEVDARVTTLSLKHFSSHALVSHLPNMHARTILARLAPVDRGLLVGFGNLRSLRPECMYRFAVFTPSHLLMPALQSAYNGKARQERDFPKSGNLLHQQIDYVVSKAARLWALRRKLEDLYRRSRLVGMRGEVVVGEGDDFFWGGDEVGLLREERLDPPLIFAVMLGTWRAVPRFIAAGELLELSPSESLQALPPDLVAQYQREAVSLSNSWQACVMHVAPTHYKTSTRKSAQFDLHSYNYMTANLDKIQSLVCMLDKKHGEIRDHGLGKRCDHTGRAVLGCNPFLPVGRVMLGMGVFFSQYKQLAVTSDNLEEVRRFVDRVQEKRRALRAFLDGGGGGSHSARRRFYKKNHVVRQRDVYPSVGRFKGGGGPPPPPQQGVCEPPGGSAGGGGGGHPPLVWSHFSSLDGQGKKYSSVVKVGSVVEVSLQPGDKQLINRQPTLSPMSTRQFEVDLPRREYFQEVPLPARNFACATDARRLHWKKGAVALEDSPYFMSLNVLDETPFAGDNDGDVLTFITVQKESTARETAALMDSKHHIVTPQAGESSMPFVQDVMATAHVLSRLDPVFSRPTVRAIGARLLGMGRALHLAGVGGSRGDAAAAAAAVAAAAAAPAQQSFSELVVRFLPPRTAAILRGVCFDKATAGTGPETLIKQVYAEDSPDAAAYFLSFMSVVGAYWSFKNAVTLNFAELAAAEPLPLLPPGSAAPAPTGAARGAGGLPAYFARVFATRPSWCLREKRHRGIEERFHARNVRMHAYTDEYARYLNQVTRDWLRRSVAGEAGAPESTDELGRCRASVAMLNSITCGAKGSIDDLRAFVLSVGPHFFTNAVIERAVGGRFCVYDPFPAKNKSLPGTGASAAPGDDCLATKIDFLTRSGFVQGTFLKGLSSRESGFHMISSRQVVGQNVRTVAVTGYWQRIVTFALQDIFYGAPGVVQYNSGRILFLCKNLSNYKSTYPTSACFLLKTLWPRFVRDFPGAAHFCQRGEFQDLDAFHSWALAATGWGEAAAACCPGLLQELEAAVATARSAVVQMQSIAETDPFSLLPTNLEGALPPQLRLWTSYRIDPPHAAPAAWLARYAKSIIYAQKVLAVAAEMPPRSPDRAYAVTELCPANLPPARREAEARVGGGAAGSLPKAGGEEDEDDKEDEEEAEERLEAFLVRLLARQRLAGMSYGCPVGGLASSAFGERGTQETLNTRHKASSASRSTSGLPRLRSLTRGSSDKNDLIVFGTLQTEEEAVARLGRDAEFYRSWRSSGRSCRRAGFQGSLQRPYPRPLPFLDCARAEPSDFQAVLGQSNITDILVHLDSVADDLRDLQEMAQQLRAHGGVSLILEQADECVAADENDDELLEPETRLWDYDGPAPRITPELRARSVGGKIVFRKKGVPAARIVLRNLLHPRTPTRFCTRLYAELRRKGPSFARWAVWKTSDLQFIVVYMRLIHYAAPTFANPEPEPATNHASPSTSGPVRERPRPVPLTAEVALSAAATAPKKKTAKRTRGVAEGSRPAAETKAREAQGVPPLREEKRKKKRRTEYLPAPDPGPEKDARAAAAKKKKKRPRAAEAEPAKSRAPNNSPAEEGHSRQQQQQQQQMDSIVARLASSKDQQRDYMQTLCRAKKKKKAAEFTYQNDEFFIQIMAGQTIVDCLPQTGLENVDVDLRNRQLRVTFYPEAFRMDRIVNMLARPEYVPGTATIQDPKVVYNLWGIEACRVCLKIELQKACSSLGSIHELHCRVLADAMTLSGELVSLNRFGFRHSHPNPFSRCTFERNGLTFIQETLSQTTELCNNNFKFLMGSRGTLGTDYFTAEDDATTDS